MSRSSFERYTSTFLGTLLEIVKCAKKEALSLFEEAEVAAKALRDRDQEPVPTEREAQDKTLLLCYSVACLEVACDCVPVAELIADATGDVDANAEPLDDIQDSETVFLNAAEEKDLHERFRRTHAASILASSAVELAGPLILSKETQVAANAIFFQLHAMWSCRCSVVDYIVFLW